MRFGLLLHCHESRFNNSGFDFFFQTSLNPVRVLKMEAEEEKSEIARMSSFIGAIAIGDLVKSTLGPKGMDKFIHAFRPQCAFNQITNGNCSDET